MPEQVHLPTDGHMFVLLRGGDTVEFIGIDGLAALTVDVTSGGQGESYLRIKPPAGWKRRHGVIETSYAPASDGGSQTTFEIAGTVSERFSTCEPPVTGESIEPLTVPDDGTGYMVGIAETCTPLRSFATEQEASEFIGTLEGHEDGRYYLDGPEE